MSQEPTPKPPPEGRPERAELVAQLRRAVEEGRYLPDPERTAEALLRAATEGPPTPRG